MEETINLKELLSTLKKRLVMIILIAITAALVSGVISYFYLTPIYQASTQLLINQKRENQTVNSGDIQVQANVQLINTYNVIIKSPAILDKVALKLGSDITSGQLNGAITVGQEANSQVVRISVRDTSAKRAAEIANTTAEVFQTEIVKIMNVDNVNILAKAVENNYPVEPNPIRNIAIALVIGLLLGVGLAFLLDYFDNTIKSEVDIEKELGLPVLGVIATIDEIKLEEMKERRAARKSTARSENIGI
ncbi:YveK family protein [Neobacillus vireti]|uniref:YveK family protein n=1 Tax=Neobacillus vireti TaxID=220686 RepID=UPI0030007D6B